MMLSRTWLSVVAACACANALYIPPSIEHLEVDSADSALDLAVPRSQQAFAGFVNQQEVLDVAREERKVNVTLGVMSRCPDAEYIEDLFERVLQRAGGLVNFDLTYIGEIDDKEEQWGVRCKHGPGECAGNVHQLCVREAAGPEDFGAWFSTFTDCVNYGKQGDEDAARECARLAGIDWDKQVAKCVEGKQGRRLLRDSVLRSQDLGITTSASILIDSRLVCVYDDGQWNDCDRRDVSDWVSRIRKEYNKINA